MAKKFYSKNFKYLKFDLDETHFKYAVFSHKNNKGIHFDIRLASVSTPDTVYSWSSKKNPLDRNYPVPIRRSKDHPEEFLTKEGSFSKKGHVNVYTCISKGTANLIEIDKKAGLLFEGDDRNFRIVPQRGKRYFYHQID